MCLRHREPGQPLWNPSPFSSPQRAIGSPDRGDQGQVWPHQSSQPPLLSREQQEQLQRMEVRAPLLYGRGGRAERTQEGSSGGSTYEAVQDEVRRQLRGVVEQLEASRVEANELRQEVARLQATQGVAARQAIEDQATAMVQPTGPPTTLGGHLHTGASTQSTSGLHAGASTRSTSGLHAGTSMPPATSGLHAGTSMPATSGLHAGASTQSALGLHAGASTQSTSGLHAGTSTQSTSGLHAGTSMSITSGLHAGTSMPTTSGLPAGASTSGTLGVQAGAPVIHSATTAAEGTPVEASADPMARLLEGLEKVIKKGAKGAEEVTKGGTDVPKLPEITENASVDFGDWLHCLEHSMGDISSGSSEWWQSVQDDAKIFYDGYQAADQLGRLTITPVASDDTKDVKWSRVDRRAASMLMGAVPDEVRRDLIAMRARTTLDIMCRLMVLYRPGSATEKSQLLRNLESPEPANTPGEALDKLRQWLRYQQRAADLGLVIPDPSVLLRGLDVMVKKPLGDAPEMSFRLNLLRYHMKVDVTPTLDNVKAIHKAMLGEFEQLGARRMKKFEPMATKLRAVDATTSPSTTTTGRHSAGNGGRAKGSDQRPCKFYLSDEGCRRGKSCRYEHSMKDISKAERRERCYECGAKGHMSSACPTRREQPQQRAMSTSDSPQSSTGGTHNKKGGRQPKNEEPVEQGVSAETTATTPTSTAEPPVQGVPLEQLIEDAQRLMKAFMDQKAGPTVKVLRVDGESSRVLEDSPSLKELLKEPEEWGRLCQMGLLDSGATHPLRPRTSEDQAAGLGPVNVTLAGENKVQMDQTRAGTILGGKDTQPIVPLGTLVKALGYEFAWDRKGCRLRHPTKKEIKVFTRSTCPEILQCDALRLIAKLKETMQSLSQLRASVMVAKERGERSWTETTTEYMKSGAREDGLKAVLAAPFMHQVPMDVQLAVVTDLPKDDEEAWQWFKQSPLNRVRRRQLWQAPEWTVHLFSGEGVRNDPLRDLPGLIEVDVRKGWDLNNDKIYGVLLWAARSGRIKHVIGGPPAATFMPFRYRGVSKGPQPVRSTLHPWGMPEGLGHDDRARVKNENVMLFKMVWLWAFAEAATPKEDGAWHQVGFLP